MVKTVKKGDKVKVDYEGSFDDGEIFDSSKHGDHSHPLEFEVGNGQVIKGFEEEVLGMKKGEEKKFALAPADAYGESDPRLSQKIPRAALPKDKEPEVGMALMIASPDGRQFPVRIIDVDEENITVDINHPLAGKRINFKIKLLEIE